MRRRRKKWIKGALKIKRRRTRRGARVKALRAGQLHHDMGLPLDQTISDVDLRAHEAEVRRELSEAHRSGDRHAQGRALQRLQRVMLAKRLRTFKHRSAR